MPNNWKKHKLGDVLLIKNGKSKPKENGNIPIYGGNGILGYTNTFNCDSESLIIGRVGAYCGSTYFETNKVWISDNALYGKCIKDDNLKFIYFLLRDLNLNQFAGGSSQPLLTQDSLNRIEINLPSLPEQQAIAEILSSLDDKIELNLQTNKTLEEMANALYKHWFVDFGPFLPSGRCPQDGRGPIHGFVESELGLIPESFKVASLDEVTLKITDGAHLSPKTEEVGYPMASVKDMFDWGINTNTCRLISKEDFLILVQQGCKPLKNDILIAKDGSFLKHSFVVESDLELVLLSSIAILRPNEKINTHLLNLQLKQESTKERLKSIVSGAVIQRIVLKDFRKFKILLPSIDIQNKVIPNIESLIKQCWCNNSENEILKQTRDYLLPKLISGEIRVKDAEAYTSRPPAGGQPHLKERIKK